MSKEGLNPYQAYIKRISFIEKALGEGVLEKKPVSDVISERDQDIALVWNLNDEVSGEKLSESFLKPTGKPLTRERLRQINQVFLTTTWKNVSPKLQASHPLEELLSRKLHSLGKKTSQVRKLVNEGQVSSAALKSIGLSIENIASIRHTLGKRDIEVPSLLVYNNFVEKVKKEDDDKKLQEILDSFTGAVLKAYINNHRKDKEKVFIDLSSVLRKAGFYPHKKLKFFVEKLKENGIPIGESLETQSKKKGKITLTYHILFAKHQERIIKILGDDSDLQKFKVNPVQLVCGNFDGKIPTTSAFRKKRALPKQYRSVQGIIKEVTGYIAGSKGHIKIEDFLSGCPVPVFKYRNQRIYPLDRTKELKSFLKSKQGTV